MDTGRQALLFREVNDRIYELLESAEPDLPGEFLCECGSDCGQRVLLVPSAFAALRERGRGVRALDCQRLLFRRGRRQESVTGSLPALG